MPITPVASTTPLASAQTIGAAAPSTAAASTAPTGANASTATTTAGSETQQAADRFLTLLVTQLKNQDPLNPLDNAQVTTQLAQISTVSGINKLNDTVAALSASFAANQYLQAVGMVGHDVVVAGSGIALSGGKASYGIALAAPADKVVVTIKDAAGNVVRTVDLGAQKSGYLRFDWDGKNNAGGAQANGSYTFEVTATAKGTAVAADPLSIGKVTGVSKTAGGAILTLAGLGNVALTDVLQIN